MKKFQAPSNATKISKKLQTQGVTILPPAGKAKGSKASPASAKKGGKAKGSTAPKAPRLDPAQPIKWLTKENPKREGSDSHARFNKYKGAATVGAYLAKGGTAADLRWDSAKGYLSV